MPDPFTVYGGRGFTFLASPVLVTSPPQANEPQNSPYLNTYAPPSWCWGSASKHQSASIPAARFLFPSFSASRFQFCFPCRGRLEVFKDAQSHMNVVNTYECPYKSSKINRSNLKTSGLEAADSRPRGSGSIPIMVPQKVKARFFQEDTFSCLYQ